MSYLNYVPGGTKTKLEYSRLNGEPFRPRQYAISAIQLSLGVIEITKPKLSPKDEVAKSDLDKLHQERRYLVRSLAMGLPLAKAGLTDLSARIALETRIDCAIYQKFGRRPQKIVVRKSFIVGGKRFPERTLGFAPMSLEDYFRIYYELKDEGLIQGVNRIVELTGIDPENPTVPRWVGPVVAMFNGDDNFRGNPAYGTSRGCINTEKRGQVIEKSKTSSSRRYIGYCQSHGYTPWSRLVEIVIDHAERLEREKVSKWSYPCEAGKPTYITRNDARTKLLSQASKGGRDKNIRSCDTSVTGRSALLTREVSYSPRKDRMKLHFLHRIAYPQWYTNLTVQERLPAALGGIDAQDYLDPDVVWANLNLRQRKLINLLTTGEPQAANAAGRVLNRARLSPMDVHVDDEELRHKKGLEIVQEWNRLATEEIDKIKIFEYGEARVYATVSIARVSQKSQSVISGSSYSSLGDATGGTERSTRNIRRTMNQVFTRLDRIDNSIARLPYLIQVYENKAKQPSPPNPTKGMERAQWRINRTKLVDDSPQEIKRPVGKTPYEWLYSATHGREARKYILTADYERLLPPRVFSINMLPGSLYGYKELKTNLARKKRCEVIRVAKVSRQRIFPSLTGTRATLFQTFSDRISLISETRKEQKAREGKHDWTNPWEDLNVEDIED